MIHIEQFVFNSFQTRCCIIWNDEGNCFITDPGCSTPEELSKVTDFIGSKGLTPAGILLTHAHFDHIYGMSELAKEYGISVYAHRNELFSIEKTNPYVCNTYGLPLPEIFPMVKVISEARFPCRFETVSEGDIIEAGSIRLEVLETPGHSAGGLCFFERSAKVLISGDTLFAGAIGRSDHPGGDYDQLMKSIFEKIMILDGDVQVIPGHGPATDIATERMTNPFLMPFNEPYED